MKLVRLFFITLVCCSFFSCSRNKNPKEIEADLFKLFKKIDYRRRPDMYSTDTSDRYDVDSLSAANDTFEKKLKYYTAEYPFTLSYRFRSIDTLGLVTVNSNDGLFRIYSWDTGMGGTQIDYDNVFQYKYREKTNSVVAIDSDQELTAYDTIYTLKRNNKTYYLAVYTEKMDFHDFTSGVRIFSIENNVLKSNVKIIKTSTGLHGQLEYDYIDSFRYTDEVDDDWFDIRYDEKSATLKIPVILGSGKATGNFIIYKFTGQYFERVKN